MSPDAAFSCSVQTNDLPTSPQKSSRMEGKRVSEGPACPACPAQVDGFQRSQGPRGLNAYQLSTPVPAFIPD
jgi:hypothetical protein